MSYRVFLLAGAVLAGCQTAETVAPTRIGASRFPVAMLTGMTVRS